LGERNDWLGQAHAQLQLQHQVDIIVHNQTCEQYQKEIQDHQALQRWYETERETHTTTQAQYIEINTMFTDLVGVVDSLYAHIPTTSSHGCDIPPGFNLSIVKSLATP
jgi:hypothetical protein